MNNIVFAGGVVPQDMRKNRRLEIIVPDEGEIIIVPPACSYGGSADGIHICIEQPLINLKQTVSVPDVENGGIRHAARQAVNFFNGRKSFCLRPCLSPRKRLKDCPKPTKPSLFCRSCR